MYIYDGDITTKVKNKMERMSTLPS